MSVLLHIYDDFDWWYVCLIARIPIFMLGVLFTSVDLKNVKYRTFLVLIVISLLMYYPCFLLSSKFFASSLLVIPVMIVAILFKQKLGLRAMSFLVFIGKHSLEIYLANVLVMYTMNVYPLKIYIEPFYYVILQIVYTCLLIWGGQHINIWLKTVDKQLIKIS